MSDLEDIAKSLSKCREIKAEILRFGVSQLEILKLIKLLALELEDREKMVSITKCVDAENTGLIIQED
tara:strand:+ start:1018 stop:1221 length:204 start_codon:yes stop_codon:yes gene_type:complete